MPTGYTSKIKDDISFEKYALDCARAFGACVTLRDEPGGGEQIPEEFKASEYNLEQGKMAEEKFELLSKLTDEEKEAEALRKYKEAEANRVKRIEENEQLKRKYEAMLENVEQWKPPTQDHEEMKKFMKDQIVSSIDFDCGGSYWSEPTEKLTGDEWYKQERSRALENIAYHAKQHREELARVETRTKWVQDLRDSLK